MVFVRIIGKHQGHKIVSLPIDHRLAYWLRCEDCQELLTLDELQEMPQGIENIR